MGALFTRLSSSKIYLCVCVLFVGLGYYLLFFTNGANYFHGGSPASAIITWAAGVLGSYGCIELARASRRRWLRMAWDIIMAPLATMLILAMYSGIEGA